MPYLPRTRDEILTFLLAHALAKSGLTDTAAGSVLATILGSVAEDVEGVEYRMALIRDSFDFTRAVGADLDERVADMPGVDPRRDEGFAGGSVMQFTRATTVGTLVVPAGSLFALGNDPRILYRLDSSITFAAGEATYPAAGSTDYAAVTCLTSGLAGNANVGAVNVVVNAPSDVISCINLVALSGGRARETDDELRQRALAYLSSLARCQPRALEFFALNHEDADGKTVAYAYIFEDPSQLGYSELVVDDGTGLTGLVQTGQTVTGTLPASTGTTGMMYHPGPAVAPITTITNTTTATTYTDTSGAIWKSCEERGIVYLLEGQTAFSPGDGWSIDGTDYQVYGGWLRSFQAVVEGNPNDPLGVPGLRASGTRVKVMPPVPQLLDFTINVILEVGADFDTVAADVEDTVLSYMASLGPGAPYFESQLIDQLHNVTGISAVEVLAPGVSQLFPNSTRKSFRAGTIKVT